MEAKPLKKGENDLSKSHVKCIAPPISRDSSWEKSDVLGIILDGRFLYVMCDPANRHEGVPRDTAPSMFLATSCEGHTM